MPLLDQGQLGNDKLGVGLYLLNDQAIGHKIKSINLALTGAYHKVLGADESHVLSLGVEAGFIQKRIELDQLVFLDQFDPTFFEPTVATGESIFDDKTFAFDLGVGLTWTAKFSDRFFPEIGAAISHLTAPNESFSEGFDSNLPRLITAHGKLLFDINDDFNIEPGFMYLNQGPFDEIIAGATAEYVLEDGFRSKTSFHLGAWYRMRDAFILMTAFEFRNFQLGISYDINTSDLSNVAKGNGAYEISFVYNHQGFRSFPVRKSIPAIRQ
jgi:type IX secretion system PorP/SprF family membrane protein